ncbi:MAG: YegP family protein [Saprospiraceae bacterium]|nr:YegP family protein [Saprospiraceae bacterium]MBK7810345.1 YegP family protein [Saprospiraceae bacterium]MBK9629949.1 YegP family protein [Saprospiraceae bacterium]
MNQSGHVDDDYLICREYEEQMTQKSDNYPDFISFQHTNGKYYFAWVNKDYQIIMRGEGYSDTSDRDHGINSVIENRELKERYKLIESHGAFFLTLRDTNHQEIGRSCPKNDEASLWSLIPFFNIEEIENTNKKDDSENFSKFGNSSDLKTDPLAPAFGPPPIVIHSDGSSEDSSPNKGFSAWWLILVILFILILWRWKSCNQSDAAKLPSTEQPSISEPSTPQPAAPPPIDVKSVRDSVAK